MYAGFNWRAPAVGGGLLGVMSGGVARRKVEYTGEVVGESILGAWMITLI